MIFFILYGCLLSYIKGYFVILIMEYVLYFYEKKIKCNNE